MLDSVMRGGNILRGMMSLGAIAIAFAGYSTSASADGVVPENAVVIVNEASGEGLMSVKNTDATPVLLYTRLKTVPEDKENRLVATPQIARVQAAETQLVRFVLKPGKPLETEKMQRVLFEGIPQASKGGNVVRFNIRQDLPVIIRPKGLAPNSKPWTLLEWGVSGDALRVHNPSPYVVRLIPKAILMPSSTPVELPKAYILPGESVSVALPQGSKANLAQTQKVRLNPVSTYGLDAGTFDAKLTLIK